MNQRTLFTLVIMLAWLGVDAAADDKKERRGMIHHLGGPVDHDDTEEDEDRGRDAIRIGTSDDDSFREGIDGFDPGMDAWNDEMDGPAAGGEPRSRVDDAEVEIERLLDTHDRNRRRINRAREREADRVRERWRDFNERWREPAEAVSSGERRPSNDWRDMMERTRERPAAPSTPPDEPTSPDQPGQPPSTEERPALQPPPRPPVPTNEDGLPADLINAGGLDEPGPELSPDAPADPPAIPPADPEPSDPGERTGLRPDLDERVEGLRPPERDPDRERIPSEAEEVRGGSDLIDDDLAELIDAVREGRRPDHISERDWAAITDRLEAELAELEADGAAAETSLRDRERDTLQPLEEAIREAREDFDEELDAENELTPAERERLDRERAARRRASDYSEARERFREAVARFRESQGEDAGRDVSHATGGGLGGAWEKVGQALHNIARMMDTSGRPGPPPVDRWDGEGLPLPAWMRINDHTDRIKAKIIAYAAELEGVIYQIQNIHEVMARADRRAVRNKKAELWYRDWVRRRWNHPLYQAYRRRDIRELIRDLNASRDERTAARLTELQQRGEYLINELAVDVERLGDVAPDELPPIVNRLPEVARPSEAPGPDDGSG